MMQLLLPEMISLVGKAVDKDQAESVNKNRESIHFQDVEGLSTIRKNQLGTENDTSSSTWNN